MTARENFRRMMRHEGPRWLPMDLPVTPPVRDMIVQKLGGREIETAFELDFRFVWCCPRQSPEVWRQAFSEIGAQLPARAEIGIFGITHLPSPRDNGETSSHLRQLLHPLACVREVRQIESLPWPDLNDPAIYAPLADEVKPYRDLGLVVVGGCEGTVFEPAWYLRGMENLYGDLVDENGLSDWLLDWLTERSVFVCTAYARGGLDAILLGDDVGTQRGMMMSVPFWRRHLKPRLARVIRAIRDAQREHVQVIYHSDGDIRAIIPELIEIGVDILNPMQPECMPLREVIPQYQDRLGYWGMVGTQTTMPFGNSEEVRAAVEGCAAFARGGAAVVVAPTHVLEPDVPWENIQAFTEAVASIEL